MKKLTDDGQRPTSTAQREHIVLGWAKKGTSFKMSYQNNWWVPKAPIPHMVDFNLKKNPKQTAVFHR